MAQTATPGAVQHCGDCGSHEHVGGSPDCPATAYIQRDGREEGLKTFREHQKQLTKVEGSLIHLLPCPKCQLKMVIRKNRTNGSLFYGCSGFTGIQQCDGTRSIKVEQMIIKETFTNPTSRATDSAGTAFRR